MNTILELDKQVFSKGYMKRQYMYYTLLGIYILLGLTGCILILIFSTSLLVQSLNIIAFTFFRIQAGFFGHDLAHNQVFKRKEFNRTLGFFVWGILTSLSQNFWIDKHERHHKNTNQNDADPDLDIPFIFSKDQAQAQNWFLKKFIFPFQHILFFLSTPFIYFSWIFSSYAYIFKTRNLISIYEAIAIAGSLSTIITLWIYFQGFVIGSIFILIHFLLAGVYMAIAFSPNHLGKEIIAKGKAYERVYQIVTSRNIFPSAIVTHLLGGLDYQIEHHLYPTMPRKNYPKVGPMVKEFCKKHGIEYSQTTLLGSFKEIYQALKKNSQI